MYFYKKKGKQHLDLRGDLILTHNHSPVIARAKSAAPTQVHNAIYTPPLNTFVRKWKASIAAWRFIWTMSHTALSPEQIDEVQQDL